jgi:filamentous hemagglutinin
MDAVKAFQAAQEAARAAQAPSANDPPDGLVQGGLQVAPGVTGGSTEWQGADLPWFQKEGDRTQVTVKQNDDKAILTWQTFNVGRETDLYFDQRGGGSDANAWIALNRVIDPSGSPSRILGSIKAEGRVYVVNRNGILFGGSSQVNAASLLASSLEGRERRLARGARWAGAARRRARRDHQQGLPVLRRSHRDADR